MSHPQAPKSKSLKSKIKAIFSSKKKEKKNQSHPTTNRAPAQPVDDQAKEASTYEAPDPPERYAEMRKSYRAQAVRMQAEHDAEERKLRAEARKKEEKRKLRRTADMYDRINGPQSDGVERGLNASDGSGRKDEVRIQSGRIVRGSAVDGARDSGRVLGKTTEEKKVRPANLLYDDEHYSKYERETGLVDPKILRWD